MITLDQARRALRLWGSEYIGQDQAKLWRSCVDEIIQQDADAAAARYFPVDKSQPLTLGKLDPTRPVRRIDPPGGRHRRSHRYLPVAGQIWRIAMRGRR